MWDSAIETCLMRLLEQREQGASLCPSEVAQALIGVEQGKAWRALMPKVRQVSAVLADRGLIDVIQGGHSVDIRSARGPVRLRLPAPGPR